MQGIMALTRNPQSSADEANAQAVLKQPELDHTPSAQLAWEHPCMRLPELTPDRTVICDPEEATQ